MTTAGTMGPPAVTERRVTSELVLDQIRKRDFSVLSTVNDAGLPRSAGVTYGVSRPGRDLAIYVMTRSHLEKARNIARNPNVSLVAKVAIPTEQL